MAIATPTLTCLWLDQSKTGLRQASDHLGHTWKEDHVQGYRIACDTCHQPTDQAWISPKREWVCDRHIKLYDATYN